MLSRAARSSRRSSSSRSRSSNGYPTVTVPDVNGDNGSGGGASDWWGSRSVIVGWTERTRRTVIAEGYAFGAAGPKHWALIGRRARAALPRRSRAWQRSRRLLVTHRRSSPSRTPRAGRMREATTRRLLAPALARLRRRPTSTRPNLALRPASSRPSLPTHQRSEWVRLHRSHQQCKAAYGGAENSGCHDGDRGCQPARLAVVR